VTYRHDIEDYSSYYFFIPAPAFASLLLAPPMEPADGVAGLPVEPIASGALFPGGVPVLEVAFSLLPGVRPSDLAAASPLRPGADFRQESRAAPVMPLHCLSAGTAPVLLCENATGDNKRATAPAATIILITFMWPPLVRKIRT
jgi:hypothetical protein